jgi:hypothetical protein
MSRLRLLLCALPIALAACGGSHHARIPVDSPIRPWQPPAIVEDEEDDDSGGGAADAGDSDDDDHRAPQHHVH